MARICESCKYYDASGEQASCPTCNGPLRFTLLAPPGQAGAALAAQPAEAPAPPRPRPGYSGGYSGQPSPFLGMLGNAFKYRLLLSLIVGPILLGLSLIFGVNLGQPTLKQKYDRLQVGMDFDEVREIMEPRTSSRRFPGRRMSMFDNFPDEGPATLTWEEHGATVTLEFEDGELVKKKQTGLK